MSGGDITPPILVLRLGGAVECSLPRTSARAAPTDGAASGLNLPDLALEPTSEPYIGHDRRVGQSLIGWLHLGDDPVVGLDRLLTALGHEPSPAEYQARRNTTLPGDIRNRHLVLGRFLHHPQLLLQRAPPTTVDPGDDCHSIWTDRHGRSRSNIWLARCLWTSGRDHCRRPKSAQWRRFRRGDCQILAVRRRTVQIASVAERRGHTDHRALLSM